MIHLELTNEEERDLKEEVTKRLAALDHEIAHTEALNFKDMLKRRRATVQKFLSKLPDPVPAAA
jgi:uncharacterized membrane protein YdbT with pleckstrin-like domain